MNDYDWGSADVVEKDDSSGEMIVAKFKDCPPYCKWLAEFSLLQSDKTYRSTHRCISLFCDEDGPILVSGSCTHFSERKQKPPRGQRWIAEQLDRLEAKLDSIIAAMDHASGEPEPGTHTYWRTKEAQPEPKPTSAMFCGDCKFWEAHAKTGEGTCRNPFSQRVNHPCPFDYTCGCHRGGE